MPSTNLRWYRLPSNDLCIAVPVAYAWTDTLLTWDSYAQCSRPLHIWLIVTGLLLALFRLVHRLAHASAPDDIHGSGCFDLFISNRKLHAVAVAGVLYPFFVVWVLLGSSWYSVAHRELDCFSDSAQDWYFSLWLLVCYLWVMTYTSAIAISAMIYCSHTALYESVYRHLPASDGLPQSTINRFPSQRLTGPDLNFPSCSICLEDLKPGEIVRTIPCSHPFHQICIDPWLRLHRECPLCKRPASQPAAPVLFPLFTL